MEAGHNDGQMNVHHLELFYQVAKHRGISQAARFMPYGIQQPAISSQLLQLEEHLRVKLFHRRPFALTPAGEELYRFAAPFFGNLVAMTEKMRGHISQKLNLAASPTILRDYVPGLVDGLRRDFPGLTLTTREIAPVKAEEILQSGDVEMVITLLEKKSAPGVQIRKVLELPMILLVPARGFPPTAARLLTQEICSREPLVSLPGTETLPRFFNQELKKRGLEWTPSIEVNSLEIIQEYVVRKFGLGLSVAIPGRAVPASLRSMPLPGFPKIVVGAMWRGKLSAVASAFLRRLEIAARAL